MSDLRLAFASTAIANLDWSEVSERPVDRVAASGRCKALGVAVWKARYQQDRRAAMEAAMLLGPIVAARWPRDAAQTAQAIIGQALIEYLQDKCLTCEGRRDVVIEEVKYVCMRCQGTGVRRWLDTERAENMQISYAMTKASGHKIAWILGYITSIDNRVNHRMNIELERIPTHKYAEDK